MLILEDKHNKLPPVPLTVVMLEIPGIFLYPYPPEVKFNLKIPPLAVGDGVP